MKIEQLSPSQIQINVEGKGRFELEIGDWGGEYPGVDITFVPENAKENITLPRVLFELDQSVPVVRVWENPYKEDPAYRHRFPVTEYIEENTEEKEDRE